MNKTQELPVYRCRHVERPILLDGNVHKTVWRDARAEWLVPTTGKMPQPEHLSVEQDADSFFAHARFAPGTLYQPTSLRARWSNTHLYLAYECADRDIWGTYTQRDDPLYDEEVVEAFLSPTADVRHYYEFEVSPRNVLFDAKVHSPDKRRATMTVDKKWDCPGIASAVRIQGSLDDRHDVDNAWSVELAIPFAAFPEAGAPKRGARWRANFYRIDRADPPEYSAWSPTLEIPPNFHVPDRFGWLEFTD